MGRGRPRKPREGEEGYVEPEIVETPKVQITEHLYFSFDSYNIIVKIKRIVGEGVEEGDELETSETKKRKVGVIKQENIGKEYFTTLAYFPRYDGISSALRYCIGYETFLDVTTLEAILYNQEKLYKMIKENLKILVEMETELNLKVDTIKQEELDKIAKQEAERIEKIEAKKERKSAKKAIKHKTVSGKTY